MQQVKVSFDIQPDFPLYTETQLYHFEATPPQVTAPDPALLYTYWGYTPITEQDLAYTVLHLRTITIHMHGC